jgi:hypothetical protein
MIGHGADFGMVEFQPALEAHWGPDFDTDDTGDLI